MKSMSGSKLFVIAIATGLIAAALVVFYMNQVEAKYRRAATPKKEAMVSVVVPRTNMSKGERVQKKDIAARKIPEKYLPANAILAQDYASLVNRTLLSPIQIGRPMTWEAVTGSKAKTFSEVVELGRRALTIKVSQVDSFDGLLRPGDIIDLMGNFELDDLGIESATGVGSTDIVMPVLERVEVIEASREDLEGTRYEVKKARNSADGFDMDFSLITLNLTPKQIARVQLAESTGEIFAVLRHPKDTSISDFDYVGVEVLLTKPIDEPVDIVLDENGRPVGRVVGDNIVDSNGNIVGKVVGGKAVSFDGKVIGQIVSNVAEDDPINRVAKHVDVVRNEKGEIVGHIIDGQVVDVATGKVVGTIDKKGQAISVSGELLGSVDRGVAVDSSGNEVDLSKSSVAAAKTRRQKIVRDAAGNVVGRIVDGNVLDAKGRTIGRIDKNGRAIGMNGRKLGSVVEALVNRQGEVVAQEREVVRDSEGRILGQVVDGKVIDKSGKVIGTVDARGRVNIGDASLGAVETRKVVRDANGNVMGRVVDGKVLDIDGNVVGLVSEDGVARDNQGRILGRTSSEKVVRDKQGNIVGRVVDGKVLDKSGRVVGVISADGKAMPVSNRELGEMDEINVVRNSSGEVIGRVVDGKIIDGEGRQIGSVDKNGVARSLSGDRIGVVSKERVVRDAQGVVIGRVVDGKVVNAKGEIVGVVDANGRVMAVDRPPVATLGKALVNEDGEVVANLSEVVRDKNGNIIARIVGDEAVDADGNVIGRVDADGNVRDDSGQILGAKDVVALDTDGRTLQRAVEVVRDSQGNIIGRLVDGKVMDERGKVLGKYQNGQVVDEHGTVIASGVNITSESELSVASEMNKIEQARLINSVQMVDFIAGGTSKDGITPVKKVRKE